ncbi:MAG TPA: hypothetical protein VFB59_04210 [Candidatus Saccharimonadales bacterium]|nr:hypothetical protein [Candidatus Saccharimonadales bacterium]
MKKLYIAAAISAVIGVLLAGSLAGTALAWHPVGKIKKHVQNVTTNGTKSDAEDEATAVNAKPGDTLKYTVKVWNEGQPNQQGLNDMVETVMTDMLPAGVELISNPAKRDITENIGRLRPGESKTFEYDVKVTKQQSGAIKNTACFTGDTEVHDNHQEDCDDAFVKATVEDKKPEEPKPTTPQILSTTTLPVTGPGSVVGLFVGISGLGYLAHRLFNRKK